MFHLQQRMLLLIFLCFICLAGAAVVSDGIQDELYPPYEEYDPHILDPLHAYGSPYGGFSRATARRLAALPLQLPEILLSDNDGGSDEQEAWSPLYTTVRDGRTGQLFACRVYHEDELMPESLQDSMFDPPKLKGSRTKDGDDDTKDENVETSPNDESSSSGVRENGASTLMQEESSEELSAETLETTNQATEETSDSAAVVQEANAGAKQGQGGYVPPSEAQQAFTLIRLSHKIKVLSGLCTQIHKGWWSYEWCYEKSLSQFHVTVQPSTNSFEIQDVTSLGDFTERSWATEWEDDDLTPLAGDVQELARVTDHHDGGTVCPETGEPRQSVVKLVCCTDTVMASIKAAVRKGDQRVSDKSNLMALYDIQEDPDKVCHYNVTICTPILCNPDLKPIKANQATATSDAAAKAEDVDRSKHKPNESIMDILERTLGGRRPLCLQSITGGWWTFEFCHGKSIRQYHEVVGTRRDKSGTPQTTRVVETDHNLGKPQTSVFREIEPEDEWKFVVNATDKNGAKKPYFELEYTNGDICDDDDVRDAAIVAGNTGAKGLARSSSVRYSCGEAYDITVNEDSTCHYMVNIVVPDLCRHPLFKTPVSKKQVFKCLPVDEPNAEDSLLFS